MKIVLWDWILKPVESGGTNSGQLVSELNGAVGHPVVVRMVGKLVNVRKKPTVGVRSAVGETAHCPDSSVGIKAQWQIHYLKGMRKMLPRTGKLPSPWENM